MNIELAIFTIILPALLLLPTCADTSGVTTRRVEEMGGEGRKLATFAAGCFWGVESTFRSVEGVTDTLVGYTGGHTENPTYEEVCAHGTGHAEAVLVEYDPRRVSYGELLEVFFDSHNPTNAYYANENPGSQYRSSIFYRGEAQRQEAEAMVRELEEQGRFAHPIATRIEPADTFWKAEEYHQRYYSRRGLGPACATG